MALFITVLSESASSLRPSTNSGKEELWAAIIWSNTSSGTIRLALRFRESTCNPCDPRDVTCGRHGGAITKVQACSERERFKLLVVHQADSEEASR